MNRFVVSARCLEDTWIVGDEIELIPNIKTFEECNELCEKRPGCLFIAWHKPEYRTSNKLRCDLLSSFKEKKFNAKQVSGEVGCTI